MELNTHLLDFLELMATGNLSEKENKEQFDVQYAKITGNLSKKEMSLFTRLYKQVIDLKMNALDQLMDSVEDGMSRFESKTDKAA